MTPPRSPYYHLSPKSASVSSLTDDVLSDGDIVGPGLTLNGELINDPFNSPRRFQVIRKLGTGSYAVVYLVRELLAQLDDDSPLFDWEIQPTTNFGQEYAIKVLSKANLDDDALKAQMDEATIHQSLPQHPNIVTLHRTFESKSFLILLLEFVPGEDLFYFLEQARDHFDHELATPPLSEAGSSSSSASSSAAHPSSVTPPTPSLLSSLHPSQLLSRTRLRLIASMFGQMCDAVAACHDAGVFHRDIKPENFIVTDAWEQGRRRVLVKLTDFGLSTTDEESPDMDCGSAPYMSYECRNNCAPTYAPRAADVWSLGIVLINMLYHHNPWTDTADGACPSFRNFRAQPVSFFMQRFAGMTPSVAEYLATNIFCILRPGISRVSVREFGRWTKEELPSLLASCEFNGIALSGAKPGHHRRTSSTLTTTAHPLGSIPCSRRPSSRLPSRMVSRTASLERPTPAPAPLFEEDGDAEAEAEMEMELQQEESQSRSTSNAKRRKRGARKKGKDKEVNGVESPVAPIPPSDELLESLAIASQQLAREVSQASKSKKAMSDVGADEVNERGRPAKKSSKWKDILRMGSTDNLRAAHLASRDEVPPVPPLPPQRSTANNVADLIMGLSAPSSLSLSAEASSVRSRRPKSPAPSVAASLAPPQTEWRTDRSPANPSIQATVPAASGSASNSVNWRNSTVTTTSTSSAFTRFSNASTRSVSTVATSVSASSWRNSSTSQVQVNKTPPTVIPSPPHKPEKLRPPPPANVKIMHGMPWALHELPRQLHPQPVGDIFGGPPVRQKREKRKPKEPQLGTISEWGGPTSQRPSIPQSHSSVSAAASSSTPALTSSPVRTRTDASTSTTDLHHLGLEGNGGSELSSPASNGIPKKVQKGQINALAKMLNALRL